MKEKFLRKMIAYIGVVVMAVMMMANTPVKVFAATNGSKDTQTITVKTKANWFVPGGESITLGNSKVTVNYCSSWTGKSKSKSIYPSYKVTVKATDGTHSYTRMMTGSSLKLSLERDKEYTITVSYDSNRTWLEYCTLKNANMSGSPYWWVKSTHKVSSYE